jgi:hypothetical protein
MRMRRIPLVVLAMLVTTTCSYAPPPRERTATWQAVGTWSGRGSILLGTFTIDSGDWRVLWEAKNEAAPGAGRLEVTLHSADSGRHLADVVKQTGVGRGTVPMTEHARRFYLSVDSVNVDWTLTAEQAALRK